MDLSPDEDHFQGRLLHQAALWDNLELLQELLLTGVAADSRDSAKRSALHAAALAERSRCLAALCKAGAELDAKSDDFTGGKTALHIAAERGHVENVKTLLSAGASICVVDTNGDTALALAERNSHRHAANALREARDALERERLAAHAQLRELLATGNVQKLTERLQALGSEAGLVANLTPGGANTLLYVASESGLTGAVSALLSAGADGRAHPVTKYGPLYIACYHGHEKIAKLLLDQFPTAVQQETVEKWLPLHAACIGGHATLVTLLLSYPYPQSVLSTYTDARGQWQYSAAFDVNARDVSSQTALYIACTLGNLAVVDALLSHSVPCVAIGDSQPPSSPPRAAILSPQRGGISLGIHAIVSKLTGASSRTPEPAERRVTPVRCDSMRGADSAVAAAARGGHVRVLRSLMRAGAHGHAPASVPQSNTDNNRTSRRRSRSACADRTEPSPSRAHYTNDREVLWTALAVACRLRHTQVAEILLSHGASDPNGLATRECAVNGLTDLMVKILATKAYPDPDYKLNKSTISEHVFSRKQDSALTFSSMAPSTAVCVNWRGLGTHVTTVRMSWLRIACQHVNNKLSSSCALHALTRLDVANNELRLLPSQLFTLLSIRYINAAQNKLERLPFPGDPVEDDDRRSKPTVVKECYTAPALQELYLQDNRLEELPPSLFTLPALVTLDVSNNKLRSLPPQMWNAPCLRDLNAALNHLKDLPGGDSEQDCGSPLQLASPVIEQLSASPSNNAFSFTSSKSWSRSPSIERSETDTLCEDDNLPAVANRAGNAVWSDARRAHTWRGVVEPASPPASRGASPLHSLNLSHNQFTCVPAALACRAPALTRLNMAYNSLRSMSYVTSYPTSLRQLDLSHNEITCWPSLPQLELFSAGSGALTCYCRERAAPRAVPCGSARMQLLNAACVARRHTRLEAVRTLILANNLLTRIQLTTDDDGQTVTDVAQDAVAEEDDDWASGSTLKGKLLFPLLSMLDVSCNMIRNVPPRIHELTNLSVLNLSGNNDITDLPPQMGLLSRLWSLNATGCSLQEPLRSMLTGGKYKSADIVGYLKSVLHAATKYTRMKLMIVGQQDIGKTSLLECLRQESALQHRRKPTEHWAKRMGNKSSRRNMSTVGVDVGTWVYEKGRSSRGPITFRTWDFGGQQEYYATHQYFLSRRSLYLVVWRVTDGKRGLASALDWLRSIQARAPGSPVIMVATHYDQVANSHLPESESPETLQRLIRSRIMGAPDADKLGLPRVLDSLEVSCSTRHNIRLLADIIYSVAFSVKPPGSKEPLLEQRIPATYLALEECVTSLAQELPEPVLTHNEYKKLVTQYMQQKNHKMFRDAAELHQATMFLHENGVLLHYDDATLKQLYFLRPQWLCDVLAHVVTVREINPFASNGIMKIEELSHVFKASPMLVRSEDASSLGVSLLNKFELALCWDARVLLVPSLLPPAEPVAPQLSVRCRQPTGTPRRTWPAAAPLALMERQTDSPTLIQESGSITIEGRTGEASLRRLLLVTYIPCGFWARLCTRVLADLALTSLPRAAYRTFTPTEVEDDSISKALELSWGWKLWRRGVKLVCGELTLLSVREIPPRCDALLGPGETGEERDCCVSKLRIRQEGAWCDLDLDSSACIEILLPSQVAVARRDDGLPIAGYQSISLEPNPEVLAKVLALISDHVDLLLEDWYPSLGTRFVHTSEGRCLITRLVPCPACLRDVTLRRHDDIVPPQLAFRRLDLGPAEPRPRLSEESRASDGDSGVGAESNASSRIGSVEGVVSSPESWAYAWTVEQCILSACTSTPISCPQHAHVALRHVAPDTLLLDLPEESRARWEHITRTSVAGRGAFGTVLKALWKPPGASEGIQVALKALQPVPPPGSCDIQTQHAYKAAMSRWDRDPLAGACRAYCGLRQELSILSRLRHPHVLPLRAACCAPLALLLALAPGGALDGVLREYRGCGARLSARCARAVLLQVARALEYLHDRRIVYRDLKSENVLVWRLPRVSETAASETFDGPLDVHVKLGDLGISRLAPPSGTKGFGGTEGFMAPEIMRYNGEEEYNEKVDCFSFGMLTYEVVTGRQPFEGHEAVKEAVLEGARPSLSPRDLEYPCCMLETMRRCWSGAPELRPSAAALVSVVSAPEFIALRDAAAARGRDCGAAGLVALPDEAGHGWEIWYGGEDPERVHTLLADKAHFTQHHTVRILPDKSEAVLVTAICRVGDMMWIGDSIGRLSAYSASTCALVWSTSVQDVVGGASHGISSLFSLDTIQRVAVALSSGRLFLVTSYQPEAEGTFILTELGMATDLCCLTALPVDDGYSVWAGGDSLYTYRVSGEGVSDAECAHSQGRVTALTAGGGVIGSGEGSCVYQWDVTSREQLARLDCSKLVPCSESLQSIGTELQPAAHTTRVLSVCWCGGSVYIGTAWGCVVVADGALRPLTVFRPYESDVSVIIPLPPHKEGDPPMLATLGCGYRPLLQRYAPTQTSNSSIQFTGNYCLLWRAQHWLPD